MAIVRNVFRCESTRAPRIDLHRENRELRPSAEEIKRACEAAGLTLGEVSRSCRVDRAALWRLENEHDKNPMLDTVWRYAASVGRRVLRSAEASRDTRPAHGKANRVRASRER
jgi:transcriptional regulator with XRE-family HTH domain